MILVGGQYDGDLNSASLSILLSSRNSVLTSASLSVLLYRDIQRRSTCSDSG
jgi:hypothetical protein